MIGLGFFYHDFYSVNYCKGFSYYYFRFNYRKGFFNYFFKDVLHRQGTGFLYSAKMVFSVQISGGFFTADLGIQYNSPKFEGFIYLNFGRFITADLGTLYITATVSVLFIETKL